MGNNKRNHDRKTDIKAMAEKCPISLDRAKEIAQDQLLENFLEVVLDQLEPLGLPDLNDRPFYNPSWFEEEGWVFYYIPGWGSGFFRGYMIDREYNADYIAVNLKTGETRMFST